MKERKKQLKNESEGRWTKESFEWRMVSKIYQILRRKRMRQWECNKNTSGISGITDGEFLLVRSKKTKEIIKESGIIIPENNNRK